MKNNRQQYSLPKNPKKVLDEAIKLARTIRVDELDCRKSFHRVATNESIEWVIKGCLSNKQTHWTLIYRDMSEYTRESSYWDFGASFMHENGVSYFLWIELTPINGGKLVEKFKLENLWDKFTTSAITSPNSKKVRR